MKKIVMLLSVFLLITGCSVTRIDNISIDKVVDTSVAVKIKSRNAIGKGYKYYLPKGVTRQSIDEYNERLYSNDDVYYLFIDVVSYLKKVDVEIPKHSDSYYFKELDKGYIKIDEKDNEYYVNIYYNYSYIESYVKKENINTAVSNMIFILSTMKFKKNILTSGASDEIISSYEETFSIKTSSKKEKINFLDYAAQYDEYTGPQIEIVDDEKNTTDLESDIITKDNKKE